MSALPDLAIVYEHPQWFEPLFEALDRRGVSYVKLPLAGSAPRLNGPNADDR